MNGAMEPSTSIGNRARTLRPNRVLFRPIVSLRHVCDTSTLEWDSTATVANIETQSGYCQGPETTGNYKIERRQVANAAPNQLEKANIHKPLPNVAAHADCMSAVRCENSKDKAG